MIHFLSSKVCDIKMPTSGAASDLTLLMGTRMGLDAKTMVHVLADGAGGSRIFQVRGPVMADRSWNNATMKVEVCSSNL